MRVVYMGTPDFAVDTLDAIVKEGHEVLLVVTQPDKAKGRGKKLQFTPVKEKALEYDLLVAQPEKVREEAFMEELESLAPDVIVVVAFGQLLPERILNIPKYGCINVHASLLPAYRGAAPIQWAVIDGLEESGVTTMYMEKGLDTGDMIEKAEVVIESDDTGLTLHDKLAAVGAELIISTMEKLENGTATRTKQNDAESCYASMLSKDMGSIDFNKAAVEIERLIRGLNPWPSAYSSLNDKTLKIWKAEVVETNENAQPGTIVAVEKNALKVQTGEGVLSLLEVQIEGKKRMDAGSFLRGYTVEVGTKLQ